MPRAQSSGCAVPCEVKRVAGHAASGHVSSKVLPARASTLLAVFLLLAFLFAGVSCRSTPGTVPIGVFLPLSGPLAGFGESTRNGVEMAVQEINAGGGVGGSPLDVTYVDDRGEPEGAKEAVRRLIGNLHVAAIIGEALSANSLAAAPICQEQGVLMISPASTNPAVTEVGEFILRVCYVDPFQGTAMATFARSSLGISRVALVVKAGDGYSEGLAEHFVRTFEDLGGEVVAEAKLSGAPGSVAAAVRAVVAAEPEAVFLPLYYQDVSQVARGIAERSAKMTLLGGDGWDSPELLRLARDAVEGAYFSTHFSPEDRRGRVRAFVKSYRERYDATPDAMAALGYDAARILGEALERLREGNPKMFDALLAQNGRRPGGSDLPEARAALRDTVCAISGYDGVTGEITIDESRNVLKPAVVLQVRAGAFRYAGIVRP